MRSSTRFRTGFFVTLALGLWLALASAVFAAPKSQDNSDLNGDGIVNQADLVLFATDYLGEDAASMDWCGFVDATKLEADLYGRPSDYYTKHFPELLEFIEGAYCSLSDMNGDGRVNARDLMAFSEQYIGEHFLRVDWCAFLEAVLQGESLYGHPVDYYLSGYGELMLYVQDQNTCTDDPPPPSDMALKNSPRFLTRIAAANDLSGNYFVTDAKVGSVFVYDSNLAPIAELKGLATPLGIAVNEAGLILVGNDKRNNVEVYDPATGELLSTFGQNELETPSSISLDSQGNIYVSDASSNTIYIYDSAYKLVTNIGERGQEAHQLRGPTNALLSPDESELFVLDRLNKRIQVFDTAGNWLRSITFEGTEGTNCSWFTGVCEIPGAPAFTRVQSMAFDASGRLHVVDIFHAAITMFDPQTGQFLGTYGTFGTGPGQLKSPASLLVEQDRVLVVDGGKNTIEVLVIP